MDDAKMQELSDVREIIDVMNQYTTALDTRNWEMLEATMAPDGQADFGNLAGVGVLDSPQALVDLCRRSLQDLRATQHLQGNYVVEVERRHRAGELLPAGEPLPGGPARRRHVRRVGQVPRRLRPHRERVEDQEALPRHDLGRREHEPLHRGGRGGRPHGQRVEPSARASGRRATGARGERPVEELRWTPVTMAPMADALASRLRLASALAAARGLLALASGALAAPAADPAIAAATLRPAQIGPGYQARAAHRTATASRNGHARPVRLRLPEREAAHRPAPGELRRAQARAIAYSHEVVVYKAGKAAQAIAEVRCAAKNCPTKPVVSPYYGGPPIKYVVSPAHRRRAPAGVRSRCRST